MGNPILLVVVLLEEAAVMVICQTKVEIISLAQVLLGCQAPVATEGEQVEHQERDIIARPVQVAVRQEV